MTAVLAAFWAPIFLGTIGFTLYETLSPHHNDRREIGSPHPIAEDLKAQFESHPFLLDPHLENRIRSCFRASELHRNGSHLVMLSDDKGTWMYDLAKPADVKPADMGKINKVFVEVMDALPGARLEEKEDIVGKSGKRARRFDATHSKEDMDYFLKWAMDAVTVKVEEGGKVVCPPQ